MSVIIIGAGIIAAASAYYLSSSQRNPESIHLVEASPELFASASGFAGGFIARDWFSSSLARLGALSFDLHKELAEKNDGYNAWGYSQSTSTSLAETIGNHEGADWLREGASRAAAAENISQSGGRGPNWLKHKGNLDIMSDGRTTAQVYVAYMCSHWTIQANALVLIYASIVILDVCANFFCLSVFPAVSSSTSPPAQFPLLEETMGSSRQSNLKIL